MATWGTDWLSLYDERTRTVNGHPSRELIPSKTYLLASALMLAVGIQTIAKLWTLIAGSIFNYQTALLITEFNLILFLCAALAMAVIPWAEPKWFKLIVPEAESNRTMRFQEVGTLLLAVLIINIPMLFLARSWILMEELQYLSILSKTELHFLLDTSPYYHVPQLHDVWISAGTGFVLLIVKVTVFVRVLRERFAI